MDGADWKAKSASQVLPLTQPTAADFKLRHCPKGGCLTPPRTLV